MVHYPRTANESVWADIDQGIIDLSASAHLQIRTSLPALLWDLICNEPVSSASPEEKY